MYTLAQLQNRVKRRVSQLHASTSSSSEVESGNLLSDANILDGINAGRKQIMVLLKNAELWGSKEAVLQTVLNVQNYALDTALLKVTGIQYDTTAAGLRQTSTVDMVDVKTRKGEEAAIADPMNEPSATSPKYRLFANQGIRLIVSTDGTVTASKYFRVEYIKELDDLAQVSDDSDISDVLDDLCVEWAIFRTCQHIFPDISQVAYQSFYQTIQTMNGRGF